MTTRLFLVILLPASAALAVASEFGHLSRVSLALAAISGSLLVLVLLHRFGPLGREGRSGLRGLPRRQFRGTVVPIFVVLVLSSGHLLFEALRHDALKPVWSLPESREAKGFWVTGDAFVQVRSDAVAAYGLKDGGARWSHAFPYPQKVCAVSRSAQDGIGLVTYAEEGELCDRVTAFDLGAGRPLWTHDFPADRKYPLRYGAGAELGPGGAVVFSEHGVTVLDPRTGVPRKSSPVPSGCFPLAEEQTAAVGDGRVASLLSCRDDESIVLSVNELSTGSSWSAPLGAKTRNARLLSTDPLVVQVRRLAPEETDELFIFDPSSGNRLASIPSKGSYLGPPALATDDRIYAVAPGPDDSDELVAYSFTGETVWSTRFEHGIALTHSTGSGPAVVFEEPGDATVLTTLDPDSGAEIRKTRLPESLSSLDLTDFHLTPDLALFIEEDTGKKSSTVHAFDFGTD